MYIPAVVAVFIDPLIFDTRYLIIDLIWIPILILPHCLLKKSYLYKIAATIYFISGAMQILHWIVIRGPITVTSLIIITNTNSEEAMDFVSLKTPYQLLILIPYIYIFIKSLSARSDVKAINLNRIVAIVILSGSFIFIAENAIGGRLIRKSVPQVVKVSLSFVEQVKHYQSRSNESISKEVVATTLDENEQQTFILILGESASRRHMSIYGSKRNPSPKLSARTDIKVFDNVVSPFSSTIMGILSIMSASNLEHKLLPENEVDLVDVFHSAGFKTYWISNQFPVGHMGQQDCNVLQSVRLYQIC